MGTGIVQLAAQAGHEVVLFDTRAGAAGQALDALGKTLHKLVEKGKFNPDQVKGILDRITVANALQDLAASGLVVEAIIEDLTIKKKLFSDLEKIVPKDCVLATNTSSLSVTAIAAACELTGRVIGLHFFNPAPILPLVEVVPGLATAEGTVGKAVELMHAWGKVPVTCRDTPGFIVNRVARPFYGESLRILEEGIADMATIDHAMRSKGGFRMGPFELMDLIGNDVNFAVTQSVYNAFFQDPRYRPSLTQQRMVEAGWFGRKSGRGYYDHSKAAITTEPSNDDALLDRICGRVLVMLINEAVDALYLGIASKKDLDLAMTKGVNYPKGLLDWANEKGLSQCLSALEGLQSEYGEDRYRPSPLLRRMAADGSTFN